MPFYISPNEIRSLAQLVQHLRTRVETNLAENLLRSRLDLLKGEQLETFSNSQFVAN